MQSDGKFSVGTLDELINGKGQVFCSSKAAHDHCVNVLKTAPDAILGVFKYAPDNSRHLVEIVQSSESWEYQQEVDRLTRRINELEDELEAVRV